MTETPPEMRNWRARLVTRLIHGYFDVRLDMVWRVAREELGPLIDALEPLLPGEDDA